MPTSYYRMHKPSAEVIHSFSLLLIALALALPHHFTQGANTYNLSSLSSETTLNKLIV